MVSCFWTRCKKQEIFLKASFRRQGSMHQSWIIFPHLRQGWTGVSPFLSVLIPLILLHSLQDKSVTVFELSSPLSHRAESENQQPWWQLCTQLLTALKSSKKTTGTPCFCPQHFTPAWHKATVRSSSSIPEDTVRAPRKIQHGLAPWRTCQREPGPVSRNS